MTRTRPAVHTGYPQGQGQPLPFCSASILPVHQSKCPTSFRKPSCFDKMRNTSLPALVPRFGHIGHPHVSISGKHRHLIIIFWWYWWLLHHPSEQLPSISCPFSHCHLLPQTQIPTPFLPPQLLEALSSTHTPDKFQQKLSFIKQNLKNQFMLQRRNFLKIDFGFLNIPHMLELLPKCGEDLYLIHL